MTPNYPSSYPNSMSCKYHIIAPNDTQVGLFVILNYKFYVAKRSVTCGNLDRIGLYSHLVNF